MEKCLHFDQCYPPLAKKKKNKKSKQAIKRKQQQKYPETNNLSSFLLSRYLESVCGTLCLSR